MSAQRLAPSDVPARARRLALGLAGLGLAAMLAWPAGVRGFADALGRVAHSQLGRVERAVGTPRVDAHEGVVQLFERALRLDSTNPTLHEASGVAYERSVAREPAGALWTRAALVSARTQLRRAVALRPTWPYAWAYLAVVKYRLGEGDAEFSRALRNAARFGPWEPQVQELLAELALAGADEMQPAARADAETMLGRLATTRPPRALALARRYQALARVCPLGVAEGAWAQACGRPVNDPALRTAPATR